MALGFTKIKENSSLYLKVEDKSPMMLMLYVDDLFLTGKEELIKYARRRLAVEFKMKELGMMHYFLGIGCGRVQMVSPLDKGSMLWIS